MTLHSRVRFSRNGYGNAPNAMATRGCLVPCVVVRRKPEPHSGRSDYCKTVIDTSEGERWFCSAEEAVAAGWRAAQR